MGDDYGDDYGYDGGDDFGSNFGSSRDDFGLDRDDDYGGYGGYGGSFSERYDRANGAPFGTFDIDGDGELDFLERAAKFDHYQSLWDEEDRVSSVGEDLTLDGFDDLDDLDDMGHLNDLSDDLYKRNYYGKSDGVDKSDRPYGLYTGGNGNSGCEGLGSSTHSSSDSEVDKILSCYGEDSIYSDLASTLLLVGAMPEVEKEMFEKLESESYDDVKDGLVTLKLYYKPEYFEKTETKYSEKLPRLKEKQYNDGIELMRNKEYFKAAKILGSICNYKEAQKYIDKCNEELENIKKEKRAKMFTRLLIASGTIIGFGFLVFFILTYLL